MNDRQARALAPRLTPARMLLLLLAAGFLWRSAFIYRGPEWLSNFWLFEDFGYSLKIAKNLASGLGETFDGVVPTNGYQPLYVWLMVPVFRIFSSPLPPVYVALTLLALANVATGWFIFSLTRYITRSEWPALFGVALWMVNLAVAKNGTNGLEAGLSTLFVAASLDYFLRSEPGTAPLPRAAKLGLLLGLSFLARVDAVFVAAPVFLFTFWPDGTPARRKLPFALVTLAAFLLVVLPYAAWNLAHFGSPLPTSGQVTTGKGSLFELSARGLLASLPHVEYGLYAVGRMAVGIASAQGVVVLGPTGVERFGAAVVAAFLLAVPLFIALRAPRPDRSRVLRAVGTLTVACWLYGWGYMVHTFVPFERYFLPIVLLAIVFIASAVRGVPLRWAAALLAGLAALLVANSLPYLGATRLYAPGWYEGVAALNRIANEGDAAAGLQAGNLGYYYSKGRAINLDGVVNLDAYAAKRSGTLDQYLDRNHVKFMADESNWVMRVAEYIASPGDRRRYLARLVQRHASARYEFGVYELTPTHYASIRKLPAAPGWAELAREGFVDGKGLMSHEPGSSLAFAGSGCLELKFLRHPWSGIAEVREDGRLVQRADLYASVADPTWHVLVGGGDAGPHTYTITVSGERNPASQGTEVWFDAVLDRESCQQPRTQASGAPAQSLPGS